MTRTAELFGRDFQMNVGGATMKMHDVDPTTKQIVPMLRVVFTVEKSDNRDPNLAKVTILNLSEKNRKILEEGSRLLEQTDDYEWPLVIEAGYLENRQQIFSGDIVLAGSIHNGQDWVTTIEADDSGKKYSSARINKSYAPGTTIETLLNDLAKAMGVGLGNSVAKFAAAASDSTSRVFRKNYKKFQTGVVVSGRVSRSLDRYVSSSGFLWSIQDGQLQILGPDQTIVGTKVVLKSGKGLIGSPEKGEKGIVQATSLMQGLIVPGRLVDISSRMVTGTYKARKVVHDGDSAGNNWYTHFEGKPVDQVA